MNEAFATLILVILRLLIPATILLLIGEGLHRRKKRENQMIKPR